MRFGTCPICGYDQIERGAEICDWCENPLQAEEVVWRAEYQLTPEQQKLVFEMLMKEYPDAEVEFFPPKE